MKPQEEKKKKKERNQHATFVAFDSVLRLIKIKSFLSSPFDV